MTERPKSNKRRPNDQTFDENKFLMNCRTVAFDEIFCWRKFLAIRTVHTKECEDTIWSSEEMGKRLTYVTMPFLLRVTVRVFSTSLLLSPHAHLPFSHKKPCGITWKGAERSRVQGTRKKRKLEDFGSKLTPTHVMAKRQHRVHIHTHQIDFKMDANGVTPIPAPTHTPTRKRKMSCNARWHRTKVKFLQIDVIVHLNCEAWTEVEYFVASYFSITLITNSLKSKFVPVGTILSNQTPFFFYPTNVNWQLDQTKKTQRSPAGDRTRVFRGFVAQWLECPTGNRKTRVRSPAGLRCVFFFVWSSCQFTFVG